MSRTLSIGKVGPGPGSPGQAFLYLNPPAATSACLSDARSSQFNIRPWQPSLLGNPLLRLGLPRRFDNLLTRMAPSALAKNETGVRPNGLGSGRGMGWIALCRPAFPEASPSRPCSRSPSTSMRARVRWRRSPCSCGSRARACPRAAGPAS